MKAALVAAIACCMAAGASAQTMSRGEFKAQQERIQAEYVAQKARCRGLGGNERDICTLRAAGQRHVARAELESQYRPGPDKQEKLALARAEAEYALAKEHCDDLQGQPKDICRKDAKVGFVTAKADARAARDAAEAGENSREARHARFAWRRDETDSLYAAGKDRCDALGGHAKDLCIADLRKRYAKP